MKNFTADQLKEAMISLYSKKDDLSFKAYQIAFELLEEKIGGEKLDQFLDAYGM